MQNFMLYDQISKPRHEKTNILVSDQVWHKPGCTATEDGQRLEIWDLGRRGIVLSMQRKQRRWSASLLSHMQNIGFSHDVAHLTVRQHFKMSYWQKCIFFAHQCNFVYYMYYLFFGHKILSKNHFCLFLNSKIILNYILFWVHVTLQTKVKTSGPRGRVGKVAVFQRS